MHAVILDIDGTLIQSAEEDDRIYRDAVRRVLGDVQLRPSMGDYDPVTDSGILLQILADNAIDPDPHTVGRVRDEFVSRVRAYVEEVGPFAPLPGAREFVRRLRASPGIAIAIATGGWGETARLKLATARFDIDELAIASADDAVSRTEIMRIACARACLGAGVHTVGDFELDSCSRSFSSITYFGDGEWDRAATRRLGWQFRAVGPALGGLSGYDDPGLLDLFCRGLDSEDG